MTYTPFPHTVNIYQKPRLGNAFFVRHPTYNYTHEINALGGFDNASFDIALSSVDEMQQFLDQYIGNRVAIYADNPVEPIWEGFINRMTFDNGGSQHTISLDEMYNRVTITYTAPDSSATNAVITADGNNTDSQAIYGIKQGNLDYGYFRAGAGTANLRDTVLAQRGWPKSSITRGQGSGLLHIDCLGFFHTLEWGVYTNTATTNVQLGVMVNAVRAAVANGTIFFDNTDAAEVSANTNTINQEHIKRESSWDTLKRFAEVGDGANYWIVGITPTDFRLGTRRMYYRVFNPTIEYTARQSDGLRIRNIYGQIVPPWTVRPDAGIRVSDMLIGWDGLGDNPTETYIQAITYDANQQTVDYRGDDDTTSEGAFQVARYGKPIGRRFGAVRRAV